ncbi:hypothetical protein DFJ43DRAFT_827329 [Lentinula guzmanii]|uniref:Uncharacterized protein n=1 Tax=Lentinula guzmanii TaxID=2804957 RepID=A0AA38JSS3_9AGAR|nr:hypothetical protein DFJ43DRAFT_827329 [Lentinula guzmanii]
MIPYQIRKLTYCSLSISLIVFVFSMASNLGDNSFFLDPIASFLTIMLHLSLLWLDRRTEKLRLQPHSKISPYPISSGIPNIVCHWLLGCLWTASSVLIMFTAICTFLDGFSNTARALVLIEPVFAAAESILLLTIAVLITKHRETYQTQMASSSTLTGPTLRVS